ncbi:hypothetical protein SAMN02799622_03980 [Methylobacterium sp. UNC378MF]|nr:hypothetical protein SAMN02799622_03980 [Methylobacterium sp. UNC378MF]
MNSVSSYFAPQPKRRGLTLRTAEALRTGSAASDQGSRRAVLSRGTNLSSGAPSNGISGHLIWPALRYRMARCAAASATRPVPGRDGFPEAWVAAPLCGSACAVASTIAPQPPLPALGRETRRPMSSQVVRLHRIRPTPARSALSGFGRASGRAVARIGRVGETARSSAHLSGADPGFAQRLAPARRVPAIAARSAIRPTRRSGGLGNGCLAPDHHGAARDASIRTALPWRSNLILRTTMWSGARTEKPPPQDPP